MDDAPLVRRMLRGEECAFDEFFETYYDRVFRFAASRTGDADAAQDIAQATLVAAMRKLHAWRGEGALFTWLCAICRREIFAYWERTRQRQGAGAVPADLEDPADGPDLSLERRELARTVHETLERLPDRYGDLLEWKYIEGHAVAEIAARLHSSPKAVESMLTRARDAFRSGFVAVTRAKEQS